MRNYQRLAGFLLLLLALLLWRWVREQRQHADNHQFRRDIAALQYSRHARCRMNCRQVSESDIWHILKNGRLNSAKTRMEDHPCPSFALEGYSPDDRHHLRVIFAQCGEQTKVVTCIDLDQDYTCHCP